MVVLKSVYVLLQVFVWPCRPWKSCDSNRDLLHQENFQTIGMFVTCECKVLFSPLLFGVPFTTRYFDSGKFWIGFSALVLGFQLDSQIFFLMSLVHLLKSSFFPCLPQRNPREKLNVGIRQPYFRVVGIQVNTEGATGSSARATISPSEEEELRRLAASPNIYETIAKSIAPSIYGSLDIKKAIACLLFGGSRKRWVDHDLIL